MGTRSSKVTIDKMRSLLTVGYTYNEEMEIVDHQMAPVSGASTKRMRPIITVVAARPMSEVGFRAVPASPVTQSAPELPHHHSQANETMQSRPAPPARPKIIRPSFTQEGTETPPGQHVNEPLQKPHTHPAAPARPHSLLSSGQFVPPIPPRSHAPTDQYEQENIVNDFLERTSPVSLSPAPRRPTIILPSRSSKVLSTHSDDSWTTGDTTTSEPEAPARNMHKPRPTIIGFPRHQPHPEGGSEGGSQGTPLMGRFTNGGIAEKASSVGGFLQAGALAASKGIKERYDASSLNRRQSEPDTTKTDPVVPQTRTAPPIKPKPSLAPKPQLKPKPGFQGGHPGQDATPQVAPSLTAASVEKATAPAVEKATKQTFAVVQKHTEKSMQQAIMAKFVTPHLGSSQFVQKRTAPLVEKATNQMYSSAQKQAEASVQQAIVSTVVGQQPQTTGTKAMQGGGQPALPAGLLSKPLTASSVEKATAPTVQKATHQSFTVIQKHTEKSMQQAIMSKVITPHLGSSKFVQKRSAPLVEKATNQIYASAEKQAEASVQNAIVMTVVGQQPNPSSPEQPTRDVPTKQPSATSQALPGKMSAMAKSTLAKAHMPSPLRNGSEGQSNHSLTHLAPEPSRTGQSAEAPDVPMAGRKSFAGGIKSKLGKARPKSMNFDVLRHKNDHGDPGRTQPKEEGHEGVGKKKPPPRPSTGPLRSAGKLLSHARPGRKEDSQWDQSSSPPKHAHEMSASPPKYHHQEQTTRTDVPHGVALYDYTASQPDELSFQAGDTITLLRKVDDQWFYGQTRGQEGIFPCGFIDVLVPVPDDGNARIVGDVNYSSQPAPDHHPSNSHTTAGKEAQDNCSGVKAAALYEFMGEPGELSFLTGAALCVHGKLTHDWLYGELYGEYGRFPASFVTVDMEKLPQLELDSMGGVAGQGPRGGDKGREQPSGVSGWEHGNGSIPCSWEAQDKGYETSGGDQHQKATFCIAQHPFTGESAEDLTFAAGDRIKLLAYIDSDWLKGSLNGQEGIFPRAFVDIVEDVTSDMSGATVHHGHVTTPPVATRRDTAHKTYAEPSRSMARALFDFTGDTDEDLSFKCGQEIVILEWINNDWVKGRLAGRTGIFPANFVEIVEG